MKTLYLECAMGAAGDMLLAALLELLPDRSGFLEQLNRLGLPGVHFCAEPASRCGVAGTHVTVTVHGAEEGDHLHDHSHPHHTTLSDITRAIDTLPVSQSVKGHAKAVYGRIAAAESAVHGQPVEAVHFHEVGAWDAVADVVGVCLAMEALGPEQVLVSPVHVGCGHVRCAHGLLPVPAPATAQLLLGVPTYGGEVRGELCTPTGAALLTQFADDFGPCPVMTTRRIGCGMGSREFDRANCLRAFWGETAAPAEEITELCCNLDDMTGEAIGYAMERLLEAGALDVFTTAIGMKKSRPGILLSCICRPTDAAAMTQLLLLHTTTLGVRQKSCQRTALSRRTETVSTAYGPVTVKYAEGPGIRKCKAEYEDLARAARTHGVSLEEIRRSIPE